MFKIMIGKTRSEFSVVGIADAVKRTAKFQGQLNGIPFCQSGNYELIRRRVMRAVELNKSLNEGSN